MNKPTISLKDLSNYIWQRKLFLIIWIIIISSIFVFFALKTKPQFNAKINYRFPQSEMKIGIMSDLLNFLQRGKTFNSNFQWLQKTIKNNSLNNQFIVKRKGDTFNMSISLSRTDSNNLEKDILNFTYKLDSLFIKEKFSELLSKKNNISDQIENLNSGEHTFENTVIAKKLNEILEKLVIEEYSMKNLTIESIEKVIIEDKTISKNLLILGSIVFSIWSGLMIILIQYFIKQK